MKKTKVVKKVKVAKKVRKAIIVSGGWGTRLFPLTITQSKAMFPVADKIAAEHIVNWAEEAGIEEIIFVTNLLGGEVLERYFGENAAVEQILIMAGRQDLLQQRSERRQKMKFSFVCQFNPQGDGDAVLLALDRHFTNDDEPVVVWFSDTMFCSEVSPIQLLIEDYQRNGNSVIALAQVEEEELRYFGVVKKVDIDDRCCKLSAIVEKPESNPPSDLAVIGGYVLTSELVQVLRERNERSGKITLADAFSIFLSRGGQADGSEIPGKWLDTGGWEGLARASAVLAANKSSKMRDFFIELGKRLEVELAQK